MIKTVILNLFTLFTAFHTECFASDFNVQLEVNCQGVNPNLRSLCDQITPLLEEAKDRTLQILFKEAPSPESKRLELKVRFIPGKTTLNDLLPENIGLPKNTPVPEALFLPKPYPRIFLKEQLLSSPLLKKAFAHELFHAIHAEYAPDEPRWLQEGLALAFEARFSDIKPLFFIDRSYLNPFTSIFESPPLSPISHEAYGSFYLMVRYLMNRFGEQKVFSAVFKENIKTETGWERFQNLIQRLDSEANAARVLRDFVIARFLNQRNPFGDERFFIEDMSGPVFLRERFADPSGNFSRLIQKSINLEKPFALQFWLITPNDNPSEDWDCIDLVQSFRVSAPASLPRIRAFKKPLCFRIPSLHQ